MPKDKYFRFKIKNDKLYKLSALFYDEMQGVVIEKIVPHYKKLTHQTLLNYADNNYEE